VCVLCVCWVVVVVWVPFCEDGGGGVAGLLCECVVFLSLVVDYFFVFLAVFFVGIACFCFVLCEFDCEM